MQFPFSMLLLNYAKREKEYGLTSLKLTFLRSNYRAAEKNVVISL